MPGACALVILSGFLWPGEALASGNPTVASSPGVGVAPSGHQYVFWTAGDSNIYESWYVNGWHGPIKIPQATDSLGIGPAVGLDANEDQFIFWRGSNGSLQEIWYSNGWNGPVTVPGTSGYVFSRPSIAISSTCEYVFWSGYDNNLWESWYCSGSWHGPEKEVTAGSVGAPSAAVDQAGDQYVWWSGSGGTLWEAWYVNGWHGPTNINPNTQLGSAPGAAIGSAGQYVFWEGLDGNLWETWYANGAWQGPGRMVSAPIQSAPSAGVDGSNNQYVFWFWQDGNVHESWYNASAGTWSSSFSAIIPIMGCNVSGLSRTESNDEQMGWDSFAPYGNGQTNVSGIYADMLIYSPGVVRGSTQAFVALDYADPQDGINQFRYAELGWKERPNGARNILQESNDYAGFYQNMWPPQTPGTKHYFTVLWNYHPGYYTFQLDGTSVGADYKADPLTLNRGELWGTTTSAGNQMAGGWGSNDDQTFEDAHVWDYDTGGAFKAQWYSFGYWGTEVEDSGYGGAAANNSSYYGAAAQPADGYHYEIWDNDCP